MRFRRRAIRLLWVGAVLAAAGVPARAEDVTGALRISFQATSTLHDFEGTAGGASVSLSQAAGGAWSAEVRVPVAELDTGNGWRDEGMREMFDAARHPEIIARFRDIDADQVRSSGVLPFVLRIRSVERPVQATVTDWRQTSREASFEAAFDLSLASFELEAPSTLFLRVGDRVRVTVHATLERSQAAPACAGC
jgi:polyisoprenoid-binding protein YceI